MEIILGGFLIAALIGWTITLVFLSRAWLPLANAMRVWNELDHKFDQRVQGVLDRAKANQPRVNIPTGKPEPPKQQPYNPAFMAGATAAPLIPSFMAEEQPDSSLESADA